MATIVNQEFLKPYLGTYRHAAYAKTVDIENHMSFHFDGVDIRQKTDLVGPADMNPYFNELIRKRRPGESDHIFDYRRQIYLGMTAEPLSRVVNALRKIVKSKDWKIDFSKAEKFARIPEGEDLESYTDKNYPEFKSLEAWLYTYGLERIVRDPNGLMVVMPREFAVEETEFVKPITYLISSKNTYDITDEFAVFRSDTSYPFKDNRGVVIGQEFSIMIITKFEIWEAIKINSKGDYKLELRYTHNIGELSAWRAGGVYDCIINNIPVFKSFLYGMLPALDTAAREVSDLDAEVVQHIFSQMWYYAGEDCRGCGGTGKVIKGGKNVICSDCKGGGAMTKTPYKDWVIKKPTPGEEALRAPFGGYIEKDTKIVELQDKRIQAHIERALSAINMDFLARVPLNESGKAKEVDRDEMNNFVYGVAYMLVENDLKKQYHFINEYRYSEAIPDKDDRKSMLPFIPVPETFDILSAEMIGEQVKNARSSNFDPVIVAELEIDYVSKKFINQPEIQNKIVTAKKLDPFGYMSNDEKNNLALNRDIPKEDFILSIYINFFIERAIEEKGGEFFTLERKDQLTILKQYAKEKMNEITPDRTVLETLEEIPPVE